MKLSSRTIIIKANFSNGHREKRRHWNIKSLKLKKNRGIKYITLKYILKYLPSGKGSGYSIKAAEQAAASAALKVIGQYHG